MLREPEPDYYSKETPLPPNRAQDYFHPVVTEAASPPPVTLRQYKRLLVLLAILVVIVFALLVLTIVFGVLFTEYKARTERPDSPEWLRNCVSDSGAEVYRHNAIAADSAVCSGIGSHVINVLHGNAMDAGVATALCVGVTNFQSAGIGGGSFLLYYNRSNKSVVAFNFRETAPADARRDMYNSGPANASLYGGRAIAVPGEVHGLAVAHSAFGKLPWRDVVMPVVQLLRNGLRVTQPLANAIASTHPTVPDQPPFDTLKKWMRNPKTEKLYVTGDLLVDAALAATMEKIANDPMAFHNGNLTGDIAEEVRAAGGNVTVEDLRSYRTTRLDPVSVTLASRRLTLYSVPPPSSGAVLAFILAIVDGYAYADGAPKASLESYATFLHRIIEAFKFAYAKRSSLGDAAFVNVTSLVANLTSAAYAQQIRGLINDAATQKVNFYGPDFEWKEDSGTTHVSLVDSDGNAFSVTSTINTAFGSLVRGNKTGIMYNNEMDDFSVPNRTNFFGLPPSPSNYVEAGKRPMSSMAPAILVDSTTGDVRFVAGAAGGSRITTGIAYILARQLYLNETVKEAVDSYRLHHQLVPNTIRYSARECDLPQQVKDALIRKGHKLEVSTASSVVEAVTRLPNGGLQANVDFRKPSKTGGV